MGRLSDYYFEGKTYQPARDGPRLAGQLARVKSYMADGQWHTLAQLAQATGGSESGVSARLRDLKKIRFGSHRIEKQHLENGLWHYRLINM